MALLETKMIQVANEPSNINEVNNEWGSFGWSVLSLQITHSQDSKTYSRGLDFFTGDKTVETTEINYATITYQRDKKMDNYAQIQALVQQYLALRQEMDDRIDEIEQADLKISLFTLNPLKALKSNVNLVKRVTGKGGISSKARKECVAVMESYLPRLEAIRNQAEMLL